MHSHQPVLREVLGQPPIEANLDQVERQDGRGLAGRIAVGVLVTEVTASRVVHEAEI